MGKGGAELSIAVQRKTTLACRSFLRMFFGEGTLIDVVGLQGNSAELLAASIDFVEPVAEVISAGKVRIKLRDLDTAVARREDLIQEVKVRRESSFVLE